MAADYVFHHSTEGSQYACTDRWSTQSVYQALSISTNESLYPCVRLKNSSILYVCKKVAFGNRNHKSTDASLVI